MGIAAAAGRRDLGLYWPHRVAAPAACALLCGVSVAHGQDIEPRAFSNSPIGVNFLVAGYAYTRGALAFDSALPVTDAEIETSSAVLAYVRVLDLWGRSGKLDVILPYTWLSGSASYAGESVERVVAGFADPRLRLSINLYGAPALTLKEFRGWEQDLIVGASLQVSVPWGQYDDSRLVNIGTNRWFVKPELGLSKALGPLTLELSAAATLFTDNTDFYGGRRRSQDPIYSTQEHLIYSFRSGIWASVDVTYFWGGSTAIDGVPKDDRQENWRIGGTLAFPVDARNSVKLYASSGVSARTGNNYDLIGIAWQYRGVRACERGAPRSTCTAHDRSSLRGRGGPAIVSHLIPGFLLMAGAVSIHLVGGLAAILYLRPRLDTETHHPLLHALGLVIWLFAVLLSLHLMQVGLWALLYWWQIGWDPSTAIYFSTVTYATIGYGDVVPPTEWRLVASMQGLTGVLMLGWSSAMVFALVSRLLDITTHPRAKGSDPR